LKIIIKKTKNMNHLYDSRTVVLKDYREIMNDKASTDEQIEKRIEYLDSLCRNIIKEELSKFLTKNHKTLHKVK
jgi:hypothetical protein